MCGQHQCLKSSNHSIQLKTYLAQCASINSIEKLSNWTYRMCARIYLPENEIIVLTWTGCTGSPSVAMTVMPWPSIVTCAGHTDANALIKRKRYRRPGVIVNISSGVFVIKPVFGSRNWPRPLINIDSGSCPVLTAKRPGKRSAASSCNQSLIKIMCVVKSKSYKCEFGSRDGGCRTITLP